MRFCFHCYEQYTTNELVAMNENTYLKLVSTESLFLENIVLFKFAVFWLL